MIRLLTPENDAAIPITSTNLTRYVRETIGTPFHHGGRLIGVGLDCGGMIIAALRKMGYTIYDKPHYNRGDGLKDMLEVLEYNNFKLKTGPPFFLEEGDIVLIRTSQIYHHLVYWTGTGTVIHSWVTAGLHKVVETTPLPEWMNNLHSVWRLRDLDK